MDISENCKEYILKRMKDEVPSDIDKDEGSFVHDALSPFSKELEKAYVENYNIFTRINPYSAEGKDLENITNPYGVFRREGKKSSGKLLVNGEVGTVLKSGVLVQSKGGLKYKVIEDTIFIDNTSIVSIEAVDIGSLYNVPSNVITELPVQINGVISITNPNPISNGYDVEDDKSLRERYLERLRTPATSGNKYHYRNWAKEVAGVGDAKVFPLWNGNGTVKVVIINSNKRAASHELIEAVSKHIEEERPIGADITVISASEKALNLSSKISIADGYNIYNIQEKFIKNLDLYIKDLVFKDTYISIAKVGSILLNTEGVLDYSELKINGLASNIGLKNEEIPALENVELGVL